MFESFLVFCYDYGVKQRKHKTLSNLPNNSRFYVLTFSIVLSLAIAAWLRLQIASDQLYYIRLEQVFGFLSIAYLYLAVITSPLSKAIGETKPWVKLLLFSRRAIGVSAAYFALLHVTVSLWGQIGGLSGLGLLPERFGWSLFFGFIALAILFIMALTSFDKVVSYMTLRRWKLLHRLVYFGGILVILHVWIIGTHLAYSWLKITIFVALVIFFGLEALRIANNVAKKHSTMKPTKKKLLAAAIWIFWVLLLVSLPLIIKNYHAENHHQGGSSHQGATHG